MFKRNLQNGSAVSSVRALFNRNTFLGFIAGASLVTAIGTFANVDAIQSMHSGMGMHGGADAASHFEYIASHLYKAIGANDAQKAQIDPLIKQAMSDIAPMHAQLRDAHQHAMMSLSANGVDRVQLEAARAQAMVQIDLISTRVAKVVADIGDLLSPEQRTALVTHLNKMHMKSGG